jgi:HNH endonuclease
MNPYVPLLEGPSFRARRFWEKTTLPPDPWDCWERTSHLDADGYSSCTVDGRYRRAHHVAWELLIGPIPEGLVCDHLCGNRACVNPAHLEWVTGRENILRGRGTGALNAKKTHCPRGHAFEGENVYYYRGSRYCKACKRVSKRGPEYRAWKRAYMREYQREWRRRRRQSDQPELF